MMFLFLGFLRFGEVVECLGCAVHSECPPFFKASARGGIAFSNDSLSHDSWANLLLMTLGSSLVVESGCLDRVLM